MAESEERRRVRAGPIVGRLLTEGKSQSLRYMREPKLFVSLERSRDKVLFILVEQLGKAIFSSVSVNQL
jgi:hypothetical protein